MIRHVALLLLLVLALVASIGASTTVWAARPPKQPAADISIFSFGYDPSSFIVGATGKVTWRNDEGRHTVTFFSLPIDSGSLAKGETFTPDFNFLGVAPGTYAYYCTIHGFARMNGEVVVP